MYQYDPYGNVIQALGSHSQINPLRYRGYYYDNELGMYYLQSRYYDAKIGRFINAGSFASTGQGFIGYNMFAYCNNNPASYEDSSGCSPWPSTIAINDGGSGYPLTSDIADTPEEQISGTINGQGNLPYANDRIGLGTYGTSGCAFIAIYNAMQLIGKPQSLQSVASEVFLYHGTVCFGAGGVGPWSIKSYFNAHGVETEGSFSSEELTQDISEGDVIVFTVWNDKTITGGWHAMTALYTNEQYLVFNQYNDSTTYATFSSLEDVYSKGVWIYGMRIE